MKAADQTQPHDWRKGGRPRCKVTADEVLRLRERGASWRAIARELRIGTATAMRLGKDCCGVPKPSLNLCVFPTRTPEASECDPETDTSSPEWITAATVAHGEEKERR
jgi:hypothetical protein